MATYTTNYNLAKPDLEDAVDIRVINDDLDIIDSAISNARALAANIGNNYNTTVSYNVGNYCIYNNVLYKCVQQTTAGEAFDPTKWAMCRITDDLGSGGSGGDSVSWTQITATGTKIATIAINGNSTDVYAPTSGGASSLSGLSDVDVTTSPPTNGQVLKYDNINNKWVNGSGGDTVSVSQVVGSGTKVATVSVNGTGTDIYAPTPIDVVANPNENVSGGLTKLKVNGTVYGVSSVEANPASTSTGTLTKVGIDGTVYDLPSGGGGGTTVIANPSGTATTELEKLQVGSSIYGISGDKANHNLADTFDDTATYSVDDYVIYNQNLYKCIIAVTTAGAFDSNNWTQVLITDEMGSGSGGSSTLSGLSDVNIQNASNGQFLTYNSTSNKWNNETKMVSLTKAQYDALPSSKLTDGIQYFITDLNVDSYWIDLIGTLTAGQTSITLSDSIITTDSTFDFYTDTFGANPTNVVATNGSITLTFEAQQSDVGVKVRVTTDGASSGGGNGNGNVTINSSTIVDISQVI